MRVTNNMMVNTLMYNLEKNLNRMNVDQSHLASGKRIHRASDDPIDASKVLKYKTDLSEITQYDTNVRDALNWLEVTESAIADMGQVLQRSRELAVQASNGVLTTDDKSKLGEEIKNLREHLMADGNFSFAGRYVFSGYQTDRALFKADGSYNVDITDGDFVVPAKTQLLIGSGEKLQISTNGIDVFGVVETPNAFNEMFTDTAGDAIGANKTALKGQFSLVQPHAGDNLNVTLGGITYDVIETALDGTDANPLNPDVVLDRYKQALAGGVGPGRLTDVADVYFDDHKNLVIEAKAQGPVVMSTASATYLPATLYSGDIAKKSELKGLFTLEGPTADYTGANLDVVVGGNTYQVDESTLNGFTFTVTKEMVVDKFRNALIGGVGPAKLSDVADVYYNDLDELVIKDRAYGANPVSIVGGPTAGFAPALTLGQNTAEATVNFSNFTFDDLYVANNEVEIKDTPIFITYNGTRQSVSLDPVTPVTTVAQYQASLQTAIDKTFGLGKVTSAIGGAAPNQYFTFTSAGTPSGTQPEMRVEIVKSKKSTMIEDFGEMYTALNAGDTVTIQKFLGKVDEHLNRILSLRAEIGAKVNRMELTKNRLSSNEVSFTAMLSETEDVDMAETIMSLKNAESVYRAALSTGTRVIQPTLIDFLR